MEADEPPVWSTHCKPLMGAVVELAGNLSVTSYIPSKPGARPANTVSESEA
jgi:hypothetical protein